MAKEIVSPKRRNMRLTHGPYDDADSAYSRSFCRYQFFCATLDRVSDVFEQLQVDVYPAFKAHPQRDDAQWRYFHAFVVSLPDHLPELVTWATRWNAGVEWFYRHTLSTLHLWEQTESSAPESFHRHRASTVEAPFYPTLPEEQARNLALLPTWDMHLQDWGTFRASMDAAYERHCQEYKERIEHLYAKAGARPGAVIRATEHLDWFIWYQVEGLSYAEITARLEEIDARGVGEDGVRKAVDGWAGLLHLPPRPALRGKPRGTKNRR